MEVYKYIVRDQFGLLIRGRLSANDVETASQNLRSLNYTILDVRALSALEKEWVYYKSRFTKVKPSDILLFNRQMASMIHSGLPILTCLDIIVNQCTNPVLKQVLESVYTDIEGGSTFANALEKHPRYFSKFFVSMINVGEISGRLDEVLTRLSEIGIKETEMKNKVKGALMYPVILITFSVLLLWGILTFVLPKFIVFYSSNKVELPVATQILIMFSTLVRQYWWLLLSVIIALVYMFHRYRNSHQGKFNLDSISLKLPVLGSVLIKYQLARFSRTLGSLIKSGISVLQALAVTESTLNNLVLITVIKDLRNSILEGMSLSDQLKKSGIFPPMVTQMIHAGEQTGKMDEMLNDVANFYDLEVDFEIRNALTLLEPILLLIMACFVVFMAIALLMPIFKMARSLR